MKATVKWVDGAMFLGESSSGHSVVMEGPEEAGGRNMGLRPMEMLLLGLGGCAAFDVVSILQKSRQNLVDCEVLIESERSEDIPKVFTRINMLFVVSGRNLKDVKVEKAVSLSADKYCSASEMLGKTAIITHEYKVLAIE